MHESRLLWPNEDIQCVVSLGTGRYEPIKVENASKVSLKEKVSKIVDSATDTEGKISKQDFCVRVVDRFLAQGLIMAMNQFIT